MATLKMRSLLLRQRHLLLLSVPAVALVFVFNYLPMYGVIVSFKNFRIGNTILDAPWVGFRWFVTFFNSPFAWRIIRNTLLLSLGLIIFAFPDSILLALLLNEIRSMRYKRIVQSVTYLPHFISTVIVVGMLKELASDQGLFNDIVRGLGWEPINFFAKPGWFRPLFIGSDIWQQIGWGTIIYLAAISSIDPGLYESATIDGAGRFQQAIHITLPSIMPTVTILFLLRLGNFFSISFEKVLLMYNPAIYETADVISTYIYREGIQAARFSYSAAVGLFLSVISMIILIISNFLVRRSNGNSIW